MITESKSIKITTLVFILLFVGCPLFADIEFSDFLFPLEKASYFGWKGFKEAMPNLYKKAKTVVLPNGDTLFYASNGKVVLRLSMVLQLSEDQSLRTIALIFTFLPKNTELRFRILTQGVNLTLPVLESLRLGQLPFYPADNEFYTRIDFFERHIPQLSIIIKKDPSHTLKADFYIYELPFLEYEEVNMPDFREFTYHLNSRELFGVQKSLKVRKYLKEGMIFGAEEYFIDNLSVSASDYLNAFENGVNSHPSLQGFIFGLWQAGFQQFVQQINF